jgi:hypothetical protein
MEDQMGEAIKDLRGRIVGYYSEGASGETNIKDPQGRILGYFDPAKNMTFHKNGTRYANGNNLRSLLG